MASLTPRVDKIDTNFLINGNFDFWQRIAGTQLTVTTNRAYGADRWMVFPSTTSAAAAQMARVISTNTGSQYDMNFGPWAFNQKCGAAQIIENANTIGLRGQTVTFSFDIKAGGFGNVRAEILSWGGTADSVTAFSNAVPYTNWTTYSLASNFTSLGVTAATSNLTGYTTVTVSGTVPTGCNNLVCVIAYADNGGQQQYVSQAQLTVGNLATPEFVRAGRTIGGEFALCQRYYEKSYDTDTNPGTNGAAGGADVYNSLGAPISNNAGMSNIHYRVTKRVTPTVIVYGFQGGLNRVSNASGTDLASGSGGSTFSGHNGFRITNQTGGSLAASEFISHYVADAEL